MARVVLGTTAALTMSLFALPAFSQDDEPGWSGEVELGAVNTTGNNRTTSIKGRTRIAYRRDPYRASFTFDALNVSSNDETTAERYESIARSEYHYNGAAYVFANLRYEADRFGGYHYRASETAGVGRSIIEEDALDLDLEIGIGARQLRPVDEPAEQEAVLRLAGNLWWTVSPTAEFRQDLVNESSRGDSANTSTQSVTALSVTIYGELAMKLSLTVTYDTRVPEGNVKTDTLSAVTLVYDF